MNKQANPPIFSDAKYVHCLGLAMQCKNDKRSDERYGSLLIKHRRVIGSGFNRAISHPSFRLERIIRQGWTNHAEIEAINDALIKGLSIYGADIYVAGYFSGSGRLFLKEEFTCKRCLPYFLKYGINAIYVPTPDGWRARTLKQAEEEAEKFCGQAYKTRKRTCIGNYNIKEILKSIPKNLVFSSGIQLS